MVFISGCAQQVKQPAKKIAAETPSSKAAEAITGVSATKSDYLILADDQPIKDNFITISKVSTKTDGWIVVRSSRDGRPGTILGESQVKLGENSNIIVKIDSSKATETMYAILHEDSGEKGKFEYPAADEPVTVGESFGEVVQKSFKITK